MKDTTKQILEFLDDPETRKGPVLLRKDLNNLFGQVRVEDALPIPGVTFANDTAVFVDYELVEEALAEARSPTEAPED